MNKQAGETVSLPVRRTRERTRILAIPGSLRAGSYNRRLLEAARELAPGDVEVELWDGLKRVPPFDEDHESDPGPGVLELRTVIAQANALLVATPQYNASLPGQLKNALDWASRPYASNVLRGKPVAVIGASPSPSGAARAQSETRVVLGAIGAEVLDVRLQIARAFEKFDGDDQLVDPELRRGLSEIVAQLATTARNRHRLAAAAA